jgi:hypothetical protein
MPVTVLCNTRHHWTRANLDRKNPRAKEDIAHPPPEQIVARILESEPRIAETMGHIQKLLGGGGS